MKDKIIKDYIDKLTIDDIKKYSNLKNINLSDSETIIIFTYIKKYYQDVLKGNDELIIKNLKEKLSLNTFKELYRVYLDYKIKYLK